MTRPIQRPDASATAVPHANTQPVAATLAAADRIVRRHRAAAVPASAAIRAMPDLVALVGADGRHAPLFEDAPALLAWMRRLVTWNRLGLDLDEHRVLEMIAQRLDARAAEQAAIRHEPPVAAP